MRLISVVMGTSSKRSRKNETRSLLNYGFRFYETSEMFPAMTELDKPRVWKGQEDYVPVGVLESTVLTLPRGKKKHLVTSVELNDEIVAPLAAGDEVGSVTLSLDGETVFHGPVVAVQAIEPGSFFSRLWDMLLMWFASLFSTG